MHPEIRLTNVSKKFGSREVLRDVSFDVQAGKVAAIIGPSGSGKTTILRCLNALTPINSGHVTVGPFSFSSDERQLDYRALRTRVGMVFQQFNLWPHKTILENLITAPMLVKKVNYEQAVSEAKHLLEHVGMLEFIHSYPSALSGGQQQRVAIARALTMSPEILLLDEITSALDPELVVDVLNVVREIVKEHKRTIVLVTHEMGFARDVADEVLFIDQGVIVEQGPPDQIFTKPRHERTKKFLQRVLTYKF